jgi:acyl-homoserine lactone synthase
MRVHVVNANNRALYFDEIEAMHRHRYQVFAIERGWRALENPHRLDMDEFDNANATYLIAIDDSGAVAGSARLIPSWLPNMLKNLFPEYCEAAAPVGPGVWEWSRHATPGRTHSPGYNIKTQLLLNIAILEFGLSRGIDTVFGILELELMPWTAELGWNSIPLGLPRSYGEGAAIASKSALTRAHLDGLRARYHIPDAILIEVPGFSEKRGRLARQWLERASRLPEAELSEARL